MPDSINGLKKLESVSYKTKWEIKEENRLYEEEQRIEGKKESESFIWNIVMVIVFFAVIAALIVIGTCGICCCAMFEYCKSRSK